MNDLERLQLLKGPLVAGGGWLAPVVAAGAAVPDDWLNDSDGANLTHVRRRFEMTQDRLASKAGVTQAALSRIEGGGDALLSTWRKLYAAMGFRLLLVPATSETIEALAARHRAERPRNLRPLRDATLRRARKRPFV